MPSGISRWSCSMEACFDELLVVLEEDRFPTIAYVDDLAAVVASNSKGGNKMKTERCPSIVARWYEGKKMRKVATKT